MRAFEINVNGKILDYRLAPKLNLKEIEIFFSEKYKVIKIWQEKRHVVGIIEKDSQKLFLKLAPTGGINALTENEYRWNEQFNRLIGKNSKFRVPRNFDKGFFNQHFYLITDYFEGPLFAERPEKGLRKEYYSQRISDIIDLSELIQELPVNEFSLEDNENYLERNLHKVESWFNDIPQEIVKKFEIKRTLDMVEYDYDKLQKRTRHGDFSPWHMFKLDNGNIGLFDGERAMRNGVEYYDICYFIQRIFSVLKNQEFAKEAYQMLVKRFYDVDKMRTILMSRAIGGFLDESLKDKPNYKIAEEFKDWVINL